MHLRASYEWDSFSGLVNEYVETEHSKGMNLASIWQSSYYR